MLIEDYSFLFHMPRPTCRIGKVRTKPGHHKPGRIGYRMAFERGNREDWDTAYFKRTAVDVWERVTTLEYVRLSR